MFSLILLSAAVAQAQTTGKLAGRVTDSSTNDGLPGADIVLLGTTMGVISGLHGEFDLLGIPVGEYDVAVSFVGYERRVVEGVQINAGYTRELDVALSKGVEFDSVVVRYEKPLIQKDAIGIPKTLTYAELEVLPVRGVDAVASIQGGVLVDGAGDLHFRAGRASEVVYFVDGVKVVGEGGVAQQAISQQEMIIGSLPAKYGDAMSGAISITTKSGGSEFFGSLEGITSGGLDGYGYNLASLSLGGPLISHRVSFFVAGEYTHEDDWRPSATEVPKLREDRLAALQQNPQVLRFADSDGNVTFIPIPTDLPRTVDTDTNGIPDAVAFRDVLAAMDVPDGFSIDSPTPIAAGEVEPVSSYQLVKGRPGFFRDNLLLSGNLTVNPGAGVSVRLTGRYQGSSRSWRDRRREIYNVDRLNRGDDETVEIGGTWTQRITPATFYQIHAEYSGYHWVEYDPSFSDDINDAIRYGDIDDPANQVATRYMLWSRKDSTYTSQFKDGDLPSSTGVFGLFSLVGSGVDTYNKESTGRLRIVGNATTQLGLNELEFGLEFERRRWRRYYLSPVDLASFVGKVDTATGFTITDYSDLPFNLIYKNIEYFGYDYLGLTESNSGDIDTFVSGINGPCNEPSPVPDPSCNTPPYEPFGYGAYVQDKIEYRDLVINLGLRVDVFDANVPVLKDPYALVPIVRAEDLSPDVARPENIGSEYAVYFDNNDNVFGFRDLDGNFYDLNGQRVGEHDILDFYSPKIPDGVKSGISSDVFEDYHPAVNWMPRIGVSFPVTDRSLFFAHYDKTSQQPLGSASTRIGGSTIALPVFPGMNEYVRAANQAEGFLENAALKPQTTTEYELGLRLRVGPRAALQVSGFFRNVDDLIQLESRGAAYPVGYATSANNDFATIKGLQAEFDFRRTRGVAINANYTLQYAHGSGSDAFSSLRLPAVPNFLYPLDFDQRHAINLNVDYRLGLGEGPSFGGIHIFENFGVNAVGSFRSGRPYMPRRIDGHISGSPNGDRMPWTSLISLKVDRRFQVANKTSATVYLWIQNLFDTANARYVYGETGLPGDNGFLARSEGVEWLVAQEARVCGGSCGGQIEERAANLRRLWTNNPAGFGIPRLIRLGLRLNM